MSMTLTACAVLAQLMVRPWSQTNEPIADRVAADFKDKAHAEAFVHYAVPPMSGVQRLPDVYPYDGKAGGAVRIVMAKDEYEPGSFLVWGLKDLGKVQLELGEFRREEGRGKGEEGRGEVILPKENLDLKVVKVWYQNGNGWYSYFGDTGFKLCPELLLNDEDLIRVDTGKQANYARLRFDDGTVKEQWINPPRQMDRSFWEGRDCYAFRPMRKEFCDAETLQPVTIAKGAFKQFFLTVHATKETPAGLYKGKVELRGGGGQRIGSIPVEVKVLDFTLPKPKCYFDDEMDFYVNVSAYNTLAMVMLYNGGDRELAKRQLKAQFVDHVAHNQDLNALRWGPGESIDLWQAMKEAGMRTDVLCGGAAVSSIGTPLELGSSARRMKAAARTWYGDQVRAHYLGHGDEEPSRWILEQRPVYAAYQKEGFRFVLAGSDNIFNRSGYLYDWHRIAKTPEDDSTTRLWNQLGTRPHVAWYANHHVGPENPEFNRRQYGLTSYLSGYSSFYNYAHHFGPYNDDSEGYKPMVFAYGHYRGVIDTLAWEGFREGVDDIRYATLAVKLARKAAKSDVLETRYAGNLALQQLASFDKTRGDLQACRLELVRHILRLKGLGL